MFGLGTSELMIILVLVLVIFGAGKLPEIGSALGRGIRGFKSEMNGEQASQKQAADATPEQKKDVV